MCSDFEFRIFDFGFSKSIVKFEIENPKSEIKVLPLSVPPPT